ncbi:MAG TPA: flagellar biosynthetic protein FliO, partial [Kofleriaceae bacterium]
MRASSIALAALALALAPRIAGADPAPVAPPAPPAAAPPVAPPPMAAIDTTPRFELLDRGDAVEVIAHHIKAARTAVLPVRSRLEIPITGAPQARRVTPGDATVKLIELDGQDATRVLSVKLGFERGDVKALSRFAQAIQVGDDLHLLIPRKLPDGDIAPRLPEPTLPRAVTARIEPPAARATAPAAPAVAAVAAPPVLGPRPDPHAASPAPIAPPAIPAGPPRLADRPAAPVAAAAATTSVTGRPRSAADALSAPGPAPATASPPAAPAAPAARSLSQALAAERDDAWSKISMYGALGLGAAGAGLWLLRRRKARPGATASIEILAQRSLGGKARIVWLSAGERELIVSVTAQQVRMLGQWRKTGPAAARPSYGHANAAADADPERYADPPAFAPPIAANDKPASPAVSGLLRLRRTSQMAAVMPDEPPRAEARGT